MTSAGTFVVTVSAAIGVAIGVAACGGRVTGPTGTVQGTFLEYAGPAPAIGNPTNTFPTSGTATFTDSGGHAVQVTIGGSGKFTVQLAAGTYAAVLAPAALAPARENVSVQANQTLKITVLCTADAGTCGLLAPGG
jgi:ABC-type molybdate transport system substrate-binding protein